MAGHNLTREEARRRAQLLNVAANEVAIDLTDGRGGPGEGTFRSTTTIRFTCREPGASTHVELTAPSVHELIFNGEPLPVAEVFDGSRIWLSGLAESNQLHVVADCAYMRTGEGLHRFVDPVDGEVYLYSQFEPYDANRVYACFDQPDLKASFELSVRAPAGWQVVSNSPPSSQEDGPPASGPPGVLWRFERTARLSTYVTALVAGPYHAVHDEHDGVPLGLYCRRSLAGHLDAEDLLAVTRAGFDFFHRVFGYRYPFDKYDQLFVPEFNAGAMENAAAVTVLEDYLFRSKVTRAAYERRAETVLHEMAHMWFGDLVTMRWWDDLWLNESFATYVSVLAQVEATRYRAGWTTFANSEKAWAMRQDQLPSTHPIACDIADIEAVGVNFDGITYAKGAAVLKQLVAWVGRAEFLSGVRAYFRRYEYGNTGLADLLAELEVASGRDLSGWSKQWLETAGLNTLRPRFETSAEGRFTSFAVAQQAPPDHPTLRSHRVAIGCYDLSTHGLLRRQRVELDVVGELTEVPALVGATQPDLVLVNDDDLGYAKIRLDDRSMATLREHIGAFADPLPRTLCWAAAWDMTRDAELPARHYLDLVLAGTAAEAEIGVVQALLRQAVAAVTQYGAPANREGALARMAAATEAAMRAEAPGGDRQLAYARAFVSVARGDDQVQLVHDLLAGCTTVPGLDVDTELRWHLLGRLVAVGAADEAEIEAELRRDPTAAGQRRAAAVRAARPSAAAKEQAWAAVVHGDQLPNAEQSATISGFMQEDQLELLAPYLERYFHDIRGVWETKTPEMAQNIVVGLYPHLQVGQQTVDRTDAYLRSNELPPAMRRLLLEGRDGTARALRARACDAQAALG